MRTTEELIEELRAKSSGTFGTGIVVGFEKKTDFVWANSANPLGDLNALVTSGGEPIAVCQVNKSETTNAGWLQALGRIQLAATEQGFSGYLESRLQHRQAVPLQWKARFGRQERFGELPGRYRARKGQSRGVLGGTNPPCMSFRPVKFVGAVRFRRRERNALRAGILDFTWAWLVSAVPTRTLHVLRVQPSLVAGWSEHFGQRIRRNSTSESSGAPKSIFLEFS